MMDVRRPVYGAKECAAEILMQASTRLGRPIIRDGFREPDRMNLADVIADVSTNNAQGACDAFKALHEATGAKDLKAWARGKSDAEIGVYMRDVARKMAQ